MANKPRQAECPKCKKRALQIEYIADKFASYVLMENGVEGECVDESGGDSSISSIICIECGWQEFDEAEEFVDKLLNTKVKPDA